MTDAPPIDPGAMLDPDASEEELEFDNVVPTAGYRMTPVVGLGGSAGAIPAMQRFFAAMPANSGMVFVVVLHLSPEYESALDSIIQGSTGMRVEVADSQELLPDHVYVIPPGKQLSLAHGNARLTELEREAGRHVTVDSFFRSLADTHGPRSVAIVFSGGDSDGALGVKRIKERGGLTIAQDPDEAEHPGMPSAAIATNRVDWVLRAGQMPARLLEYQAREQRLQMPPETGPNPAAVSRPPPSNDEAALRDVLTFLRTRTGRDFSYYKRATIVRRVARRMQVNEVDDLPAYLAYLRMHPGEAGALLQDLLISVTNFFRDREAFEALEAQIPELFRDKSSSDEVRVWVPACATGEEAYSIAILLSEYARGMAAPPSLQIFATDLDEDVLVEARNGLYLPSIAADVSPERLQRYFVKEHHGYRVRRELREMLLFAVHDLLKDSPFSRLDLVSCRNLLIYLNRSAQKRTFEMFHFALQPEGRLFLGTSESADDAQQLFSPVDKKHRLYVARPTARTKLPLASGRSSLAMAVAKQEASHPGVTLARRQIASPITPFSALRASSSERISWGEVHLKMIERFGRPSLIVNADHDILHVSERASQFLQFASGEPSTNLFRTVQPMLRAELRAALFRARQTGQPSSAVAVPVQLGEQLRHVDIHVSPTSDADGDFTLVVFDLQEPGAEPKPESRAQDESLVRHLERELEQTKRQLRDLVEQHDASTEELKASNEELQAMNEELRSATEELETSREELQSINEELTTVNSELKSKVDEVAHANSDLNNLMGATAIATIFLDRELRITRFTPPAVTLFNLIPTDVGRPLSNLHHRLSYPELLDDAAQVLRALVPIEREVPASDGQFFLARALPYRTIEDRIAGVVLTFVDVTELSLAQEAVRQAHRELERRVQERTAQLDAVNSALREEASKRQKAEKLRQELQLLLVNAQEQERSNISRELHDEVGQQITALMLSLKALESQVDRERAGQLRELRGIAESIGKEIHQLALDLRPIALDDLGLSGALSNFLEAWSAHTGLSVDFVSAGDEPRLPRVLESTLYRIVQEAMHNVLRHAAAKLVSVSLERRNNEAIVVIEDDGRGFDLEAHGTSSSRIGIAGMRERAQIVGGDLTIESRVGAGTTVRAILPIPASTK